MNDQQILALAKQVQEFLAPGNTDPYGLEETRELADGVKDGYHWQSQTRELEGDEGNIPLSFIVEYIENEDFEVANLDLEKLIEEANYLID